ncbi:hypothetical protein FHS18_003258 [Paenibacillus phyllosphaerae]|uniref:Uncharacterized protein n=1 Tax=Paenibacillus phyllosphaerae TaxID=274593 RepID=A0A7W5FND1_9BACL|nr:hypothetical protein [Paenibacillus phyllosphaerae]
MERILEVSDHAAIIVGNRSITRGNTAADVYQRVLGMTTASLPVWIVLALCGYATAGFPSTAQIGQSAIVAVSSGVIATILFFTATELVKQSPQRLAAVEATQAGEVVFTVIGELILLASVFPSPLSWAGMGIVVIGMIVHSLVATGK